MLAFEGELIEFCGPDAQCFFFRNCLEKLFPWLLRDDFAAASLQYNDKSLGLFCIPNASFYFTSFLNRRLSFSEVQCKLHQSV
jgi:hypothetical protein